MPAEALDFTGTRGRVNTIIDPVMDASRRGVDVRLLLPNSKTDAKPIRWTSQSHYEALMTAGAAFSSTSRR